MPTKDEDAAIVAISNLDPLCAEQDHAQSAISTILNSNDPFIDIQDLFSHYDILYFRSLLACRVRVSWSPRLTLCAGICELIKDPSTNKYTLIRLKLSEPLLKYRPRSDVINTLLHECIHAYFFITTSWRHSRGDDGTGHGAGFLLLADAINNHGGYEITVYHNFHDEVDSYRTHVWLCDGPCKTRPPFFGQVKRSMNRAPGKGDTWWKEHEEKCGGDWTKIAEPEMTKEQVNRMSGIERAGRQKNKIDIWIKQKMEDESFTVSNHTMAVKEQSNRKRKRPEHGEDAAHDEDARHMKAPYSDKTPTKCPICGFSVSGDTINKHLDEAHPP